uniref:1,4-alpha-glucan branching enzyme n=1 Tax=Arcella intermedia TaxID=1963864 RepID=A0A6B2KZL1_9EUKA
MTSASLVPVPKNAKRSIYGATLQRGGQAGTLFCVWAPSASRCFVIGEFSVWERDFEMFKTKDGYFEILVEKVGPGCKYKYLLEIPAFGKGKETEEVWRDDPRCPLLDYGNSRSSVVVDMEEFKWQDQDFFPPALNRIVLYELHIGSFGCSGMGKNDGTFLSAIPRLDHLKDLGINVIELMPVNQDAHGHCWGYDPISLFAVHSEFGSPNDLKRFVNEAHLRGIAVIIDWVPNHMGPTSVLERFDGKHCDSSLGHYFYSDREKRKTDYGPRLDYQNREVRKMIKDSLLMWFDSYHIDGVRVDSTGTMRLLSNGATLVESWTLLRECTDMIKQKRKDCILIAEDLKNNRDINSICGFHSQWDASFFAVIFHSLTSPEDTDRNLKSISEVITKTFTKDAYSRVIYTENHDTIPSDRQKRLPKCIDPKNPTSKYAIKRSLIAAALTLTSLGMPMLLQGQELLETSCPTWPTPPTINWESDSICQNFLRAISRLVLLRTNANGMSKGLTGNNLHVCHVNNGAGVLVFHRFETGGAGDDVIVICNLKNAHYDKYRIGLPAEGVWWVAFDSDSALGGDEERTSIDAYPEPYDNMFWSTVLSVRAYSVIILTKL